MMHKTVSSRFSSPDDAGNPAGQSQTFPVNDFEGLLSRAIAEADEGSTLVALVYLEKAAQLGSSPVLKSYLGYCTALQHNDIREAIRLCYHRSASKNQYQTRSRPNVHQS